MPINKRLKRELKKNFAKYFFIGLVLFMGITIISAFFAATDGIMGTIESEQYNCNVEDANVTLIDSLATKTFQSCINGNKGYRRHKLLRH